MRYYLIAGEASGDLHGSRLMQGLKEADPEASFRFWGGDKMASQGGHMVAHFKDTAVMGFVEVALKYNTIRRHLEHCKQDLMETRPDLLILIDYSGFNLRIARFAKEQGIMVFYYIAPKVWAWNEKRVEKIRKWVHKLYIILPFEEDYFRAHGIEAHYEGNPLVDSVEEFKQHDWNPEAFRKEYILDDRPVMALLPGSRTMELKFILPRMREVICAFPDYQWLVAAVPNIEMDVYRQLLGDAPCKLVVGNPYAVLSMAEQAVVASGTATLETALLNVPQVVCYGSHPLTVAIARRLIKINYISLVNLIMDEPVVSELIQQDCTAERITEALRAVMPGRQRRRSMLASYKQLRKRMGKSGSAKRIANAMVQEYTVRTATTYLCHYRTPIGDFTFTSDKENLLSATFEAQPVSLGFFKLTLRDKHEIPISGEEIPNVLFEARRQMDEYFKGTRREFRIPLSFHGTEFQETVWRQIQSIPYATTVTYTELAERCDNPKAARAVGQAVNANPFAVIIPCHRIIGQDGTLVGYAAGIDIKQQLLNREISTAPDLTQTLF